MNENENSHKRTSDELDNKVKLESDSNNHHNDGDVSQPPPKKIRSNEELDIRFLVSSKVSFY
jgi:hypothetical protein